MRRPRVLCVDDHPAIRRAFVRVLGGDFEVVTEPNVLAAIARLDDGEWDAVVTDVGMPGESGRELYEAILRSDRRLASKVLVHTGGVTEPSLAAWIASLPAEQVIRKPATAHELRTRVRHVIDQAA